ncbi:hypothetical protein CBG25_06380 [Arsenophonus sp. ENCA]|uniref:hypothetical protein n=1 Tax=Arsenophonus sp. ENCA TaxID=1987579 RepID=UPI000BDDD876|nr:hypothetical protein [Arsenophonus sp. ENCA]PAV05496.1 hypothetical protein CBG25_06380 [Arsenophonus sp. ENCA]
MTLTFNPYLDNERDTPPIYLPKQGQASPVCAPRFEERLNPVVVVQRLRARFQAAGKAWRSEFYTTLTQRFPDGIPADQVDALGDELMGQSTEVVVSLASHG